MAGIIPASVESSSESDGELFYCGEDPKEILKKLEKGFHKSEPAKSSSTANSSPVVPPLSNGSVTEMCKSPETKVPPKRVISPAVLDDLRLAILQRNFQVVQEIIDKGLPVDTVLKSGWSALMYACSLGQANIVKYLLAKGANSNFHKDLFTPLMVVCASKQDQEEDGLTTCANLLLQHGARVNVWERHHTTPLMFAARENYQHIVAELIERNSDVNRQDNNGWTSLCWAASKGNGQVAKLLLEAGANSSLMSLCGETATEIAFSNGHNELGDILLRAEKSKSAPAFNDKDLAVLNSGKKPTDKFSEFEAVEKQTKIYNSSGELDFFLTALDLGNWSQLFQHHEIKFEDFLLLTEEDLTKMGIDRLGVRKKILEGIQAVHKRKWERSSVPDLKRVGYISCPDAVSVMANIGTHIQYMHSTIKYLRRQIQQQPRILELGQEQANVKRLLNEASFALSICTTMKEELRFFELHLDKVQDNVELNPGDMIVETRKRRSSASLVVTVLGTTLIAFYIGWQKPEYFRKLVLLAQPWQTFAS